MRFTTENTESSGMTEGFLAALGITITILASGGASCLRGAPTHFVPILSRRAIFCAEASCRRLQERHMAVTLTLTDVDPGTTQLYVFGTVQLSGNYPSGGDTIDWTQLAKQVSVRGQSVEASMADPSYGPIQAGSPFRAGRPTSTRCSRELLPTTGKCAATRRDHPARNSPGAPPTPTRR